MIVYDSSKTRSIGRAPFFSTFIPYCTKDKFIHHSKAYLLKDEQGTLHLILGSFNLTMNGLCANRESFLSFNSIRHPSLLNDFKDFLIEGYPSLQRGFYPFLKDLNSL